MKVSDPYNYYLCGYCGLPTIIKESANNFKCHMCNKSDKIYETTVPYVSKLLGQELNAMNICDYKYFE